MRWENPIFRTDRFRDVYPKNLKLKDPDSWAIFPLVYQDPRRRVRKGEWPEQPANPAQGVGRPSRYNLFGTNRAGVDVFAQMVHGTRIGTVGGLCFDGHRGARSGSPSARLAGYLGGWVDMLLEPRDRGGDVHPVASANLGTVG